MTTADLYRAFAEHEAHGVSATYERLSLAVARDTNLLARLDALPPAKRQPNLLLAVVRFLGGPAEDPATFRSFVADHWSTVEEHVLARATQTNEPGRCAVLAPVLAGLPGPLALIEVGAAAGLCLYPDRFTYRYGDRRVGTGGPTIECEAVGMPAWTSLPSVVWRAGIDLNPLAVTNPDDVAWLDALIWPEHAHRRERLRAAAAIAAADPPHLVRGDLIEHLPALVAAAPAGATVVVFHSAVLAYLSPPRRRAFVDVVRGLPVHWISNEGPGVIPHDETAPPPPAPGAHFLLALDGRPLAWTRPHGQALTWLPASVS